MTISDMLRQHARQRPNKVALLDPGREVTYAALDRQVDHTAFALSAAGVGYGDLVGVSLSDDIEHLTMLLALGRCGATILPLDPRWPVVEANTVAENFGAKTVLCNQEPVPSGWLRVGPDWYGASKRPYLEPRVTDETPMVLSLSSGTTGLPKGPRTSHGQFVARFISFWLDMGLNRRDRFVTATPLYFGGGRTFALAMIYAGGTSCLLPPPYKPEELIDFVNRTRSTAMFLVPTQLRRLLEGGYDGFAFPYLRVLISSGSAIYASEQREVRAKLTPNLYQYYSSTEGGACSILPPEDFEGHPDSVGQPCFGVDIEVVDENDLPAATGEPGRLRYRSPASAKSYFLGEDSAAFRDGWFYPGDLGAFDEDGFLYLRGRSKDMIIRGGVNIYPNDIEQILLEAAGVREVAVVGRPSREFGEEVAAFIVGEASETELRALCAGRLAPYKVPKSFTFLDALPKTAVGKIAKTELVKLFDSAAG